MQVLNFIIWKGTVGQFEKKIYLWEIKLGNATFTYILINISIPKAFWKKLKTLCALPPWFCVLQYGGYSKYFQLKILFKHYNNDLTS